MEDQKVSRRINVLSKQISQKNIEDSKTASSVRGRNIQELTSVVERDLKSCPDMSKNLRDKEKSIKWNGWVKKFQI